MNTRRRFLKTSFTASLGLAARAWPVSTAKPNLLFIFTDDQRFDTIGALGNPHIKTPNLDRLAKRSFVFRNAYNFGGNSGAVCIPARNMAMTGKVFFHFDAGMRDKGLGPTFPKSMHAAGYETFYREKSGSANLPHIQKQFDHRKDVHMVNALRTGRAAKGIVDDAIGFVTKDRDKSKPFFMYLGFPCPHDPRWAGRRFRALYDPATLPVPPNYKAVHPWNIGDMTVRDECLEKWPRTEDAIRRHLHDYYALISSMDYDIGLMRRELVAKKAEVVDLDIPLLDKHVRVLDKADDAKMISVEIPFMKNGMRVPPGPLQNEAQTVWNHAYSQVTGYGAGRSFESLTTYAHPEIYTDLAWLGGNGVKGVNISQLVSAKAGQAGDVTMFKVMHMAHDPAWAKMQSTIEGSRGMAKDINTKLLPLLDEAAAQSAKSAGRFRNYRNHWQSVAEALAGATDDPRKANEQIRLITGGKEIEDIALDLRDMIASYGQKLGK